MSDTTNQAAALEALQKCRQLAYDADSTPEIEEIYRTADKAIADLSASQPAGTEREQYEAWHLKTFRAPAGDFDSDKYFQDPVWMAWQAGRATFPTQAAPMAWLWRMHGWAVTAHGKHRAIKQYVDTSPPPESTKASPDFIELIPLYAAPVAQAEQTEEDEFVIKRLATILAEIAIELKGPELPKHRHGYHDLAELVRVKCLECELLKVQAEELQAAAQATGQQEDDLLCDNIDALLALDAAGSLVPHGVGGHARDLLTAAASRLRALAGSQQAAKEGSGCMDCGGTGLRDSGGFHPWGEPVMIPCDCAAKVDK